MQIGFLNTVLCQDEEEDQSGQEKTMKSAVLPEVALPAKEEAKEVRPESPIRPEPPVQRRKIGEHELRNIKRLYYEVLEYVYKLYKDEDNITEIPHQSQVKWFTVCFPKCLRFLN